MHSKEPWVADGCIIDAKDRSDVGGIPSHDDIRRIVACVNACAGIPTDELEMLVRAGKVLTAHASVQKTAPPLTDERVDGVRVVMAYKAQMPPSCPVPSVRIVLDTPIPRAVRTLEASWEIFHADASRLAASLCDSLPGGTLDALTAELLRRKSVSLVVPRDGGGA